MLLYIVRAVCDVQVFEDVAIDFASDGEKNVNRLTSA